MSSGPTALLAAFDLLVNAVGSFLVAALIVAAAVRVFRIGAGRTAQLLWATPFVKVLWDAARGIPDNAYFWARIAGISQQKGSFMAGGGVQIMVPVLQLSLASLTSQGSFPSTIADLAAVGLARRAAPAAPAILASLLLGVAAVKLALRIARVIRGEGERARLRAGADRVAVRRVGRRDVEVFVSSTHEGAPFTGGALRPYVCFPAATFAALSPDERDAALEHELAHVAHHDLVLALGLDVLGDLLWFIPGSRAVRRRIDASCEHLADAAAVRAGASPVHLAAALVRVRELLATAPAGPFAALLRPRSELARRVTALLGKAAPGPRWGFHRPWAGALLTLWVMASALLSTFFGHR
jgi:Zn-dependent protease with chaperone function